MEVSCVFASVLSHEEWAKVPRATAKKLETFVTEKFEELTSCKALLETSRHNADKFALVRVYWLQKENEDLKRRLEVATATISELEAQISQLTSDASKLQSTANRLEAEAAEFRHQRNMAVDERDEHLQMQRRDSEIERLQADLSTLTKQLEGAVNAKCEALAQADEVASMKLRLEYREKRMEQERQLLNSQIETLTEDLNARTEELLNMRRDNTSRCIQSETKLTEKTQELVVANEQIKSLTELNNNFAARNEELSQKLLSLGEADAKMNESYLHEIEAKTKLPNAYKSMCEESQQHAESFKEALAELFGGFVTLLYLTGNKAEPVSVENVEETVAPKAWENKATSSKKENTKVPPAEPAEGENETTKKRITKRRKAAEPVSAESKEEPKAKKTKGKTAKKADSGNKEETQVEEAKKPQTRTGLATKREFAQSTKGPKNSTVTNWENINFKCTTKSPKGKAPNFHITTWNVDGLRSWLKKGCLDILKYDKPDILCIQKTKCAVYKLPEEVKTIEGYETLWCSSDKDGYAGVGIMVKDKPLNVIYGIDSKEHDTEGRCITVEYETFFVVNVYVPHAGRNLVNLPKRLDWNEQFEKFIKNLDSQKPVIICGDMNVAHKEIDLANPKTNTNSAGFSVEERDGMTAFLGNGYVDIYRHLYPEKEKAYTFWIYMRNARPNNVGWRLDYFLVSQRFVDNVCDNIIHSDVMGSDHCPLSLHI